MEFKEASKFQEALEKIRTEGDPKILLDALEELRNACEIAASDANLAEKAYYASAKAKEQKITARIEVLKKKQTECDAKIEALREPLISANLSGDSQRLQAIQTEMKALQAEKAQLVTEIDMLSEAHVPGDRELYEEVVKKNAIHASKREAYLSAKKEAYLLALDRIEAFEKLKRETKHYELGGGYGVNMARIREHFHSKAKKAEG